MINNLVLVAQTQVCTHVGDGVCVKREREGMKEGLRGE